MNSLTELNGYVNGLSFEYTDDRYARVIFDRETADNQTIITNEGQTVAHAIGIEIVDVVNYGVSAPSMTIDITSVYDDGVRLNWAVTPSGVTISESIPGRYVVTGIVSKGIWDQIKQPNIVLPTNLPNAFYGNWTYTTTINYTDANLGAQNQSYTTAVSVLDVNYLTNPLQFVYEPNSVVRITQTPQIASYLDSTYSGATWTITASVSSGLAIDAFTSSYASGGTFTFNSGTKGFTIVGTRTQVNNHLNNLNLDSNINEIDFTISYVLSNNQDGTTDSKIQSLINKNIQYFSNPSEPTAFYIEDTISSIIGSPQITDTTYSGSENYTVEIYPSNTNDVYVISSLGTGGTSTFNNSTKKLTIVGTKSQVNSHLTSISLQPESDVDYLFQLFYVLSTPVGAGSTKIQQLICNSNDTEVSNILLTRSYIGNRGNSIFASNTPQIIDFDTTGTNTYTITLTCSFGKFGSDNINAVNPYSYTGTKQQVNSLISQIKFYPNKDVSSNGLINYTQIKNGVTQVNQDFSVTGTAGTYQGARTLRFDATQTFTPTAEDVIYSRWAAYITAAGGGGGYSAGGGGGGGEGLYVYNQTFPSFSTYTATVGIGGAGANGQNGVVNGADGGDTIFLNFTARGGKGGKGATQGGAGGASGNGYAGGAGIYGGSNDYAGGGGAGAGTGFSNNSTGVGGNATYNGGVARGGSGGTGFWWHTDKNGNLFGPIQSYAGQGGGGGSGPAGIRSSTTDGLGQGGTDTQPAENGSRYIIGDPLYTSIGHDQYAGNGGGGGAYQNYPAGGRGADGIIVMELY